MERSDDVVAVDGILENVEKLNYGRTFPYQYGVLEVALFSAENHYHLSDDEPFEEQQHRIQQVNCREQYSREMAGRSYERCDGYGKECE